MKSILIILSMFLTQAVLASGNGGGTMGAQMQREAVILLGQDGEFTKFGYGQLINKQWKVDKLVLPNSEIVLQPEVKDALIKSNLQKRWVEIRK